MNYCIFDKPIVSRKGDHFSSSFETCEIAGICSDFPTVVMNVPTTAQQEAIAARGNILVVAGAGAGKTRTLVERCLAWLEEDPERNSLEQILMVTFTEAAGAEMRKRLRERLELKASESPAWAGHLALLETASICTLHSFCLRLVRRHFYALGLDPRLVVLQEDQTHALAQKTLDRVIETQCQGSTAAAQAVQDLVLDHGRGWDQPVRDLILRLHHYTQTLADPEGWFRDQRERLGSSEPVVWRRWLVEQFQAWRDLWGPTLARLSVENSKADECGRILARPCATLEEQALLLRQAIDADLEWPAKQKTRLRQPLTKLFEDAVFLQSLYPSGSVDPLAEDWNWVRPQMAALLETAQEFGRVFDTEKKRAGGVDFHDLEQCALRILWDRESGRPTALAEQWRHRFRLIFVDEYQDINAAQDAIIRALGGEGAAGNRFLVGDIKQSIYRFRLANPRIFLDYQRQWQASDEGRVITLSENFRSHEGILRFVNALCGVVMRRELGGIEYDDAAQLRFGNPGGRAALAAAPGGIPPVELRVLPGSAGGDEDGIALTETEREARWVARRLLALKAGTVLGGSGPRPAQWGDMVILMRSPRGKVESYVKEFARLGVPLTAARGGFYESLEIRDLISLLQVLDNPLQDYPLLAVLRSPMGGFSADDLAFVRARNPKGRFWTALVRWREAPPDGGAHAALTQRITQFLDRHQAWRRLTREQPLSRVLEHVLDETSYADWLLTQDRGGQRRANADRLLQLTRQFDSFQREGLFRFLGFVDGQRDLDVEPAAPAQSDSVRLMSIHQSKGLEFPIVVVADLGKKFNFGDRDKIILDEELGLCPQVKAPQARQFYPSLPFWMAQRRQKKETLGEELRLLYVALTRAAERLILAGTARMESALERWQDAAARGCGVTELLEARSFLDWVGGWLCREHPGAELQPVGGSALVLWQMGEVDGESSDPLPAAADSALAVEPSVDEAVLVRLERRLAWQYPHLAATRLSAKSSVSVLRREMADEEAAPWVDTPRQIEVAHSSSGRLSAAERGSAHHAFLQYVALESVGSRAALEAESIRLVAARRLTEEQASCLDFDALLAFWTSDIGQQMLLQRPSLRRELAFTARFAPRAPAGTDVSGEFVVVQGVIDLCAILPDEIWLLDFKTDHGSPQMLDQKTQEYRTQLELYAQAIGQIHRKPVTRIWLHFLSAAESRAFVWNAEGRLVLRSEIV